MGPLLLPEKSWGSAWVMEGASCCAQGHEHITCDTVRHRTGDGRNARCAQEHGRACCGGGQRVPALCVHARVLPPRDLQRLPLRPPHGAGAPACSRVLQVLRAQRKVPSALRCRHTGACFGRMHEEEWKRGSTRRLMAGAIHCAQVRAVWGDLRFLGGAQDNKEEQDRLNRTMAERRQVRSDASSLANHAWRPHTCTAAVRLYTWVKAQDAACCKSSGGVPHVALNSSQ